MQTKPPCPKPRKLRAVLLGTAPPQVRREVEGHLPGCEACRAFFLSPPSNGTSNLEPAAEQQAPVLSKTEVSLPGQARHQEPQKKDEAFPFLKPPLEPGEIGRLGGYRVLRLLGQGGMGMVFLGEDIALNRPVALKVMKPRSNEREGMRRFLREARTMAALKHDHLVPIFQAGQEGDVTWFAMELLEGETLHERLRRGPRMEVAEILRIGRELAAGLGCLHEKGLVHRDIKPPNIWLEAPGARVKILDLGLARAVQEEAPLTEAGAVVGTPGFMSPEQARGEPLDARGDLFSLGCVLYCLCAGREPFRGSSIMAILMALASEIPVPPHELNPGIPLSLSDLVQSLLAKNPEGRPASADAVRARLDAVEKSKPVPGRPTPIKPRPALPTFSGKPSKIQVPGETTAKKAVPARATMAGDPDDGPSGEPIRKKARTPKSHWLGRKRKKGGSLLLVVLALFLALGSGTWLASRFLRTGPEVSAIEPPARVAAKTFLSDLEPVQKENWPFFPPPLHPGAQPGKVIRVKGKVSPHGIFMHPPKQPTMPAGLSWNLAGKYSTFQTEVTLNDGPPFCRPVTFCLYGDGKLLWSSRPLTSQADTQSCSVPVKGVATLRITVTCQGPAFGAHAAWIEPFVE